MLRHLSKGCFNFGILFLLLLAMRVSAQSYVFVQKQVSGRSDIDASADIWIQNCAYDLARNKVHSVYIDSQLPEIKIFLEWLQAEAKTFQQEGTWVKVFPDKTGSNPFYELIPDVWHNADRNLIPDIAKYSDAQMLWESYAGSLRCSGVEIYAPGVLLHTDSIILPVADSVVFTVEYQMSAGSVLHLHLNTPAYVHTEDICASEAGIQRYEFTIPLKDASNHAFLSYTLSASSETHTWVRLSDINLRLPESAQFHLACADTLRTQPFQMISYRPEIFLAGNALRPGVRILEGPIWMNSDEKAYIFGRATCAPGMYPITLQFSDTLQHSTTCRMVLHVLLPPVKLPDLPVIHTPLPQNPIVHSSHEVRSATASASKKGSKSSKKGGKIQSAKPNTSNLIQASFIQEAVPAQHIQYQLIKDGYVSLYVLNSTGDAVRTILQYQKYMPGRYSILWDGSNDAGEVLTGGEYECRMEFLPADGTPPHSESCRLLKVF